MSQIDERQTFLRKLARTPAEALRHWPRLSTSEKEYVQSHMKLHYGEEFTRAFTSRILHNPRPDASIEVTNDPDVTPKRLESAGYRFKGNNGGVPVWVHPSGKEVWLLPRPKATPAPPAPPPGVHPPVQPPLHPDAEEAQSWAQDLEARRDALWEEAIRIKKMRNPDGSYPAGPINNYYRKLAEFDRDLKSVLEDESKLWEGPYTSQENDAIEKSLERLRELEKRPPEMEELE
jgi:hypothetical protein